MRLRVFFGKPLLTRNQYYVRLALLWAYAIAWVSGLIAFGFWFDRLPLAAKVVAVALLVIGAPTGTILFQTYEKYRNVWLQDNDRAPSAAPPSG
jgi:hypothetical protein